MVAIFSVNACDFGGVGRVESILQSAVLSWAESSNIVGREITAVTIVTVLNAPHFHFDLYLYIYIV